MKKSSLEKIVKDAYESLENINWYAFKIAKEIGTDKLRWYEIANDNEVNSNVLNGILEDLFVIHNGDNAERIIHKEIFEMFEMIEKLNNENWSEDPYIEDEVYYIKNIDGDEYSVKEAYEQELEQAFLNIEHFKADLQKEILECKFEEVQDKYLKKINNVKLDAKWNEYLERYGDEADFKVFLYENFVSESEIEELKTDGWNTDYIADTISYCKSCGETEVYGIVVKDELMSPVGEGEMPF
jgi:hypothetical protein